ncbi:antiterminator Q family protein [Testudinibacter sp. TR-2022]|uniref:antiterminator Q family protein n=1 Tax=Testudinibacter sp. TR-2022 TaxID=2585029 RepID=UPI0011197C53|nr:antiterminator Q family protein [Testudinibacter sp. TR-2022]TNH06647.1 hypothetical protein FHQ30_07310 [Pasteurellaceae bacterium Phil11]TNH25517.1 hypothetical protein FHQ29_01215 [Testudinibacter sp. TR-2022]TNH25706.1 hypothetical protein FHQ27_08880 [Testudinibacter sp. TR-2022]
MLQYNIKQILKLWGHLSTPRLGTEYPAFSLGISGAEPVKKYSVLELTDESYMVIEKVVLSLRKVNKVWYEMLLGQYVCRADEADLLAYFNTSRTTFYRELGQAEAYILGGIVNSSIEVVFYA